MKRKHPEQDLQIAVARFLRLALRAPTIWTAIGHGGGGARRGAYLKAMGLAKGWPDILVMHKAERGGPIVVGLEIKSDVGTMSPEQKNVARDFTEVRAWCVLCRSIEEVERCLRFCKVPLHASVLGKAA